MLPLFSVQAQDIPDIAKTKAELKAQEKAKAAREKDKQSAEKKLQAVQNDLVTTARKSQNIEKKLTDLEQQKSKLEHEQSYLTNRLIEDQGLSTTMFRTIYQSAQIPPYGLYFSKTPKDIILHRMIALNTTLPSLHNRMKNLDQQIGEIKKLQAEINNLITQQQDQRSNLTKSSKELENLLAKRKKLYSDASTSYQKSVKNYEVLQKQARNLEDLVAKLKPSPRPSNMERTASRAPKVQKPSIPSAGEDKFVPVAGVIKVNYGETDELGAKNQGIIFTTQDKAVAVTPMAGTVVFAGPFQNFKQLLIIEHSNSYHSLIAGLDHIETNVGANLKAGEPIGRIDRSNRQKGRLYYELRKNSKPVNPQSVLDIKNG